MIRLPDWNARLNAALTAEKVKPFAWGQSDCCRFAARLVEAMTGEDVMAGFDYSSEAEARLQIGSFGGLRQFLRHTFGPWRKPAFAHRGDVMLAKGGMAVGVCLGSRVAVMTEDRGYEALPRSAFVAAFPLGWPEVVGG